jgi:hypothetical protein
MRLCCAARDTAAQVCFRRTLNAGGSELRVLEAMCCNNLGCCLQSLGHNGSAAAQFYRAKRIFLAVDGSGGRATQVSLENWKNILKAGNRRHAARMAGAVPVQATGKDTLMTFLRWAVPRGPSFTGFALGLDAFHGRVKDVPVVAGGKKVKKEAKKGKRGKDGKNSAKATKPKAKKGSGPVYSGETLALAHYGVVNSGLSAGKKGKKRK